MTLARLKETFLRLPTHTKLIAGGALLLGLATIFPWYSDLDSYRIGESFLGLTGPTSFVGVSILILAGLSLWIFSYHLLERRIPRLPVREAILHLFTAIESLFLLAIALSIYFHPKFGVNIVSKEPRFGMMLALLGAVVLLVGAYMQNKEEIAKRDETGRLESLIKLPETPAAKPTTEMRAAVPSLPRQHVSLTPPYKKEPLKEEPRRIFSHADERAKGFVFGEGSKESQRAPGKKKEKSGEGDGSYMIRMDL